MKLILSLLIFVSLHSVAQEGAKSVESKTSIKIEIKVTEIKSTEGQIAVLLFNNENGFPQEVDKALKSQFFQIEGQEKVIEFEVPSTGEYAVTVFHDENGNKKLDTNWIGMPKEGIAVSNNAKGRMGPPKYKDASVQILEGASLQIRLKYL